MAYRPIPVKKYERWLKSKGLCIVKKDSSHEYYDYADGIRKLRTKVCIRPKKDKDVPPFHIKKNCEDLGISIEKFYEEIRTF